MAELNKLLYPVLSNIVADFIVGDKTYWKKQFAKTLKIIPLIVKLDRECCITWNEWHVKEKIIAIRQVLPGGICVKCKLSLIESVINDLIYFEKMQ